MQPILNPTSRQVLGVFARMKKSDLVVIGGGIVGIATAMTLRKRYSDLRVTVVETEKRVAAHQTGHNSGVLHSGIYYKPGSDKAINCRRGKKLMEQFCTEHSIPWDRCGKVVVATSEEELPRLDRIAERAEANGVEFERINTDQLRELEPAAAGIAALHVPETGIVNYRRVCQEMARSLKLGEATFDWSSKSRRSEPAPRRLNSPVGTATRSLAIA